MNSICVFCGSSTGSSPVFGDAARNLGGLLASRGITLVYGGSNIGLMGLVSAAARDAGGKVIGIIPERIAQNVAVQPDITLEVVPDMHARKSRMYALAEGFISLPGGIGTLDETFEVWTWNQIGYHAKPLALYDIAGYYDRLCGFLDHTASSGFVRPVQREALIVENDPETLLDRMANWSPPAGAKWD